MQNLVSAYFRLPIHIERGEGVYLYDTNNTKYLDLTAGMAVSALGYNNIRLNKVINDQASKIWHHSNLFCSDLQNQFAFQLCKNSFADKVFFGSTGAEAVETAIKFARKYGHKNSKRGKFTNVKNQIVTLSRGYHGRTLGALAAGSSVKAKEGYGPLPEGFISVEANNIEKIQKAFEYNHDIVAVLLEPIQAEGGVFVLSQEYLQAVAELCKIHDALLICDEIQCGYGRSGSLFTHTQYNITPDIVTIAKGVGNGFPLSACLVSNKVAECITPGSHGSTYGGNLLAMAVGNEVLDILLSSNIPEQVVQNSEYFMNGLKKLQKAFPNSIQEIRGKGFLIGIQTIYSAYDIVQEAVKHRLFITKTSYDGCIRLTPPLILSKIEIEYSLKKFYDIFDSLEKQRR